MDEQPVITVTFIYGTVYFTCIALSLVINIDWQRKKNTCLHYLSEIVKLSTLE